MHSTTSRPISIHKGFVEITSLIFTEDTRKTPVVYTGRIHIYKQMTASRMNLLVEARKLRKMLKGLTEAELNAAVMEVLKCRAPFHPPGDLESIMFESKKRRQPDAVSLNQINSILRFYDSVVKGVSGVSIAPTV